MTAPNPQWFRDARYGLFIHYGLYSLLGRGEWVLNKEEIPVADYMRLQAAFTAENLDFGELLRRAREDWGMRYAVLTTKHHDGFCLYDSAFTDFKAPNAAAGRDLVREFVDACRANDLRIGLYHSLNDWTCSPNAVDALERPETCYQPFIDYVHGQIVDLMSSYGEIDVMWYDGWWPFNAEGWQAEDLARKVRELQPGILFNGRSGLPGDFDTPEGHVSASARPWEACMTHNDHWGYHRGDHEFKPPKALIRMLRKCAQGQGNLLLNVGPRGDGSVPEGSIEALDAVGAWLQFNGESVFTGERFDFKLMDERGDSRGDWTDVGGYTAAGNRLYLHIDHWPGETFAIAGLECTVQAVSMLGDPELAVRWEQEDGRLVFRELPPVYDTAVPRVLALDCDRAPSLYKSGGRRNPQVPHVRYDPLPSDIQH